QSLQVEANEVYGFTLKETGAIAQSLYEKGFTTYPRVDSQYLTEDKKSEMEAIMIKISRLPEYQGKFAPKNLPDRYFNNKKVDGHDAIITTDEMPSSLTEDEKKIYDLIVRRMIMAISNPAVAEKTTVITQSTDTETGEIVEFKTHGTKYLDKGFLVFKPGKHKEEAPPLSPVIKEGLDPNGVYSVYTQVSKPPQRYTDASLVKAMENCGKKMEDEKAKEFLKKSKGIGRPATRDSVVERLINARFVERSNKSLKPTESGINAIRKITIDDIKSPTLTAAWEEQLDTIEQSNKADSLKEFATFIKDIKTTTAKWCEETEAHKVVQKRKSNKYDTGLTCPLCGGTVLRGTDSYYCSNYKEKGCKFQVKYEISSKKISEAVLTQLVEKGRTNILKGFKSKAGSTFNARLTLQDALICNKCNAIQSGNETCYKCGGELSRDSNGRKLVAFTDISK
ncbi:MAG: topoisomerase C-terminal repeat-containing protein, partial [Lachnospiraceae bacterium]|nr:topoisomerase C-terminal repeat-containing protein [Lachnospiraceae bacterium]